MKIVFFGTSNFAIPALNRLLESHHKVLAVVTQPDRKKGRRLVVSQPPTKVLALARNIPVFQPEDASAPKSIEFIKRLDAEIFVVISFGQILKRGLLAVPRKFAVNLHGSLLPKYRGAAPTNWAIINGDKTTGVTVIRMNEQMDEGDMILSQESPISESDTNITLSERLSDMGARVLLKAIDLIGSGAAINFERQDPGLATYAAKLKKSDGAIDWAMDAASIRNRVRGLLPWPGAYTMYDGKTLKILNASVEDAPAGTALQPGRIASVIKGKGIAVETGRGLIVITHLQLEGKKILDADSFVRGHKIEKGYSFVL